MRQLRSFKWPRWHKKFNAINKCGEKYKTHMLRKIMLYFLFLKLLHMLNSFLGKTCTKEIETFP